MTTFSYFIKTTGIEADSRFVRSVRKCDADFDGWEFDEWRIEMCLDGKRMSVPYKMGVGHNRRPPELSEVLHALANDANELCAPTPPTFEDWAASIGYDSDSRKAEKIYRACKRQCARLSEFLGPERLLTLVCCEEEG